MKVIMKKINIKATISLFLILIVIFYLKGKYIYLLYNENSFEYTRMILSTVSMNSLINILWFLPIMIGMLIISKYYYYKLLSFNLRYKNRKKFILHILKHILIVSFVFNFGISVLQLFLFTMRLNIKIENTLLINIFHYIFENTLINFVIIYISMLIKNYMISFTSILLITLICMKLPVSIGKYLPFINIFFTGNLSIVSIFILIITILFIYLLYLKYDIEGGKYED